MRLTYKLEKPINTKYLHYDYMPIADYDISRGNYGRITDSDIYNKLGQLEDIEDNIGIELDTLFNKATEEVWYKQENIEYDDGGNWFKELGRTTIIHNSIVSRIDLQYKQVWIKGAKQWFNIKDYGKTWALTKGELEK